LPSPFSCATVAKVSAARSRHGDRIKCKTTDQLVLRQSFTPFSALTISYKAPLYDTGIPSPDGLAGPSLARRKTSPATF
jgi:hypothetical protein